MSALSLRNRLHRSRGRLALILVVCLGAIVAVHHSDLMPMDHGHEGMESGAGMAMICLGILATGLAVAALRRAIGSLPRRGPVLAGFAACDRTLPSPPPLSRAGPPH